MGDFNDNLQSSNNQFGKHIFHDLGLVDVHTTLNSIKRCQDLPSTYNRSSTNRRIDYMIVSPQLMPFITRAGIEPFQEGLKTSDHRGLFFDIHLERVLGKPVHLSTAPHRRIQSTHPKLAPAYRRAVMEYCDKHHVFTRCSQLEEQPSARQCEQIDADITRAMLSADKKIGRTFAVPWSPVLMRARRKVRFWACLLYTSPSPRDQRGSRMPSSA